jgi:hypothetical protein
MIQIGAYPTRSNAELAQAALAAAGIPSLLESDDAGGAYPFDLSGGARLLVAEEDAEDAGALLADRPPAEASEPECDSGEEELESQEEDEREVGPSGLTRVKPDNL